MKYYPAILVLLLLSFLFQGCNKVPETPAASDKYRLVWTDAPTSTITLAWDQLDSASSAEVLYGLEDFGREYWKYPNQQKAQRVHKHYDMHTHFTKLSNLLPDTAYYFIVKDEKGVSERFWFKTAPDVPKPFTFVTGGDTKSDDEPLEAGRASNKLVGKLRPLFVMFNGDFNSGNGTDPLKWKQWLTDWQEMTTTSDGRMIPILPVHGNHENGDQANLNHIFNAPYQLGDSSRIYFSLSFGGDFIHLIALNSEIEEGKEQKEWLEKDLKDHEDFTFKIAGYHKPFHPHTSRKAEQEYQYHQWAYLFYKHGLDLSIDGDSHMHKMTYPLRPDSLSAEAFMGFVRDDSTGTLFVGEGSWGAFPRASDDEKPWTLTTGSFNQVKWVHVFPEENEAPAQMHFYTAISAEYDENETQTLFADEVEALTEENLFDIPKNIKLHATDSFGNVIKYPFYLNQTSKK